MKTLLFALPLLLTGCNATTAESTKKPSQLEADRAAVVAYLGQTLDDPKSYQLVELDSRGKFSRADSIRVSFLNRGEVRDVDITPADTAISTGRMYFHKFRAKNKAGGLVLDWNYVAVHNDGSVVSYRP